MNAKFDSQGLVPVIVQDDRTDRVLMLAYMNREALEQTQHDKRVTFYSRSRQRLWTKGETSGNFLELKSLRVDCDGDTILAKVVPAGPACHTGADTCFEEANVAGAIAELELVLRERKQAPADGSYTRQLLDEGPRRIAKKLGEEAVETVLEAESGTNERLISESADLVYHLLVLLLSRDLSFADVEAELARRRRD